MAEKEADRDFASGPVEVVVCIPTFRRPDWLARTLSSVLAQRTDFRFAVVVVDNDAARSEGAARAKELLATSAIAHRVLVEPDQGNVHAINRAFVEAQAAFAEAEFFLMIDDDEMALPGWLAAMVETAQQKNADIVGGPVLRQFDMPVPAAIARHPGLAALSLCGGVAIFAGQDWIIKFLSGDYPVYQAIAIRGVVAVLILEP